eukprot:TRINITY_DN28327_c0_g1_i2.p1 TRINITY_DN28327_c0_g1~~TRINITY_DN28327_c0_g1_i2.p1  ORF type:complete len:102 (+),score=7.85 TRINITY_DN28327_c0_g1_i2:106-411(+)
MSAGMTGISCSATMIAMSTFCSFFGSVEGDDVDEDEAIDAIGMSITLFPFQKRVYVFASLSWCTFRSKSHGLPKIMSDIHMDHITPNFILIMAHLSDTKHL